MAQERVVIRRIDRERHADVDVAALAGRQHGVVARAQLLDLRLTLDAVDSRIRRGRLHRIHQGVYAVGHTVISRRGRWMAAVLAVGEDAALSHHAAGALWGIRPTSRSRVDVTVGRALRQRPGVRIHRRTLEPDDITTHDGIPVTSPARTLADLKRLLDPHQLARAREQAEILRLPTGPILDGPFKSGHTRSELETRFLGFLETHALPTPRVNATIRAGARRLEVDCIWPEQRVALELDGHAVHNTRTAFERDRERDRLLQASGWRVVRVTWRQLHGQPAAVARDLARLLA